MCHNGHSTICFNGFYRLFGINVCNHTITNPTFLK